jgi:hypothetical protein
VLHSSFPDFIDAIISKDELNDVTSSANFTIPSSLGSNVTGDSPRTPVIMSTTGAVVEKVPDPDDDYHQFTHLLSVQLIFAIAYILIFLFGFCGNALVCYVILRRPAMR